MDSHIQGGVRAPWGLCQGGTHRAWGGMEHCLYSGIDRLCTVWCETTQFAEQFQSFFFSLKFQSKFYLLCKWTLVYFLAFSTFLLNEQLTQPWILSPKAFRKS